MGTGIEILKQRLAESRLVLLPALLAYTLLGAMHLLLGKSARGWELLSQVHRTTRSRRLRRAVEPMLIRHRRVAWTPSGQPDVAEAARLIGLRITVVKSPVSPREKGAILVKFSETIDLVTRTLHLDRLLGDYHLILEPSWTGYCDRTFLFLTQFDQPIFVMAPQADDYRFISSLASNLVPLPVGPSDWVDPRAAEPFLGVSKRYDIVFNSNWKKLKRHYLLFSALADLPDRLEVVLIGNSVDYRTADDVRALARYYGVLDQLTFLERIPFRDVMRVNCESRMAILLSLKEGSNRAIAEGFFCDIPAIVLEEHVGGITKNIVPETGRLVPQAELGAGIQRMLRDLHSFRPRSWAVENISCFATSALVNRAVREVATSIGEQWSVDLAPKSNSPEMRLVNESDRHRLAGEQRKVVQYLRGVAE